MSHRLILDVERGVICIKKFELKEYTRERFSLPNWVHYCFNRFGYDIGLQIRELRNGQIRSSQKVYYEKGDKYGQHLIGMNHDDPLMLYFNNGKRERVTVSEFYKRANDGDTILPHEIISDQDFNHNGIDLKRNLNPLFTLCLGARYSARNRTVWAQ